MECQEPHWKILVFELTNPIVAVNVKETKHNNAKNNGHL